MQNKWWTWSFVWFLYAVPCTWYKGGKVLLKKAHCDPPSSLIYLHSMTPIPKLSPARASAACSALWGIVRIWHAHTKSWTITKSAKTGERLDTFCCSTTCASDINHICLMTVRNVGESPSSSTTGHWFQPVSISTIINVCWLLPVIITRLVTLQLM